MSLIKALRADWKLNYDYSESERSAALQRTTRLLQSTGCDAAFTGRVEIR